MRVSRELERHPPHNIGRFLQQISFNGIVAGQCAGLASGTWEEEALDGTLSLSPSHAPNLGPLPPWIGVCSSAVRQSGYRDMCGFVYIKLRSSRDTWGNPIS